MPAPVTVIIPLYQSALWIKEAIESIRAQTIPPERILVLDDGSTDAGPTIAGGMPDVELIRRAHEGINATLAAGLALVQSEFVAFLDADDRWLPEKTASQSKFLSAHPSCDMVFGQTRRFRMTPEGEQTLDTLPAVMRQGGLFRHSAFERVPYFTSDSGAHSFIDWHARAMEAGLLANTTAEVVFERRIHADNRSIRHREDQRRSYLATIKAALDRRRSAP